MKKIFFLSVLISSLFAAATLTIDPTTQQVDLGAVVPDDGSYDQSFKLTVSGKTVGHSADVYVSLTDYLKNAEGDIFPAGAFGWKLYYASDWVDTTNWSGYVPGSSLGITEKVPFYVNANDRLFQIAPAVVANFDAMVGLLVRVPAVQPAGRYATTILVTVTEN